MAIWLGTPGFGLVLGWIAAYLAHHSRPGWRELKAALGVLFGAAIQSIFTGQLGLVPYGISLIVGAALYGLTLLSRPLRHTHDFIIFSPRR